MLLRNISRKARRPSSLVGVCIGRHVGNLNALNCLNDTIKFSKSRGWRRGDVDYRVGVSLFTLLGCILLAAKNPSEAQPSEAQPIAALASSRQKTENIIYRRSDVQAHTTKEAGIWVTFKDGVYDVTSFVANHPGGVEKLMMAAGKDLSELWKLPKFQQHYRSPLAFELLEMEMGMEMEVWRRARRLGQ